MATILAKTTLSGSKTDTGAPDVQDPGPLIFTVMKTNKPHFEGIAWIDPSVAVELQ